jgi:SAM-dependent methyltransferase
MNEISLQNKQAWEYRAYEFWNISNGTPSEKAAKIIQNPKACLRHHQKYFENIKDLQIANPCGSNGRIAVPLSLLGADVTIFDISEENKRYAIELAQSAGVSIHYEVCDFCDIDLNQYEEFFDIAYLEGGILHYFHDINKFAGVLHHIIKQNGKLILSDFHPFRKIIPVGQTGKSAVSTNGDYFDCEAHNSSVAYQNYFPQEEQTSFPSCTLRFYTISEILNAFINVGFTLKEFNEHPNWDDGKIPGEFTIYAIK